METVPVVGDSVSDVTFAMRSVLKMLSSLLVRFLNRSY